MKIEVEVRVPEAKRKEVLAQMIVLVDTREKSNQHIIDYFEKNNVAYRKQNLEVGDYSFEMPANEFWPTAIQFTNQIIIERKNSLEELSGNLANDRLRFESELAECYDRKLKVFLLVENSTFSQIFRGEYKTQYHKNAFTGSFVTFMIRYGFSPMFIPKEEMGFVIFTFFQYFLKEQIK